MTPNLVDLRGGLTVPTEAYQFLFRLLDRGLTLTVDGERLRVRGTPGTTPDLTEVEVAGIRRWKPHLCALVEYRAP